MERFEIRNCGPSRNFLDGHGSYLFIESRRLRYTSDPELAKLLATNPRVSVTDLKGGKAVTGPPAIQPPQGPPPPVEDDDKIVEVSYESLCKTDIQVLAKNRGIPTNHVPRLDLIAALEVADQEEKAAKVDTSIDYNALDYKDLQEIAKERDLRYVGVSRVGLILSLQADDKVETEPEPEVNDDGQKGNDDTDEQ